MGINDSSEKCVVLLATFNGEKFLSQQIVSINEQKNVMKQIYFSDDCSFDRSNEICKNYGCVDLNPDQLNFRSAASNFFHLIKTVTLEESVEYVFLSDQDDIWQPDKMISAILALKASGCDAYSGSFNTCDISGETTGYVNKCYKQTDIDYFFRSPGPGFTFCFNRSAFEVIKQSISSANNLDDVRWHDWYIYAQARILNIPWFIDSRAFASYRLHDTNDTGQLSSFSQLRSRLRFLMSGLFRKQVILMTVGSQHSLKKSIVRFNVFDRLRLITQVNKMRSKTLDRFALVVWAAFSRKD